MTHFFEEHTSEVRMRVHAPTLPLLFAEAGAGLSELFGGNAVQQKCIQQQCIKEERVSLKASDRDALLFEWLNELIYLSERTRIVFTHFDINRVGDHVLEATIRGHAAPYARYFVKAATFHDLSISQTKEGYAVTVVLDV